VARPRKFDTDLLLDKAMHLFWKQGYEQTSVQDLGQALAVHPGTLYDTFGDKHALLLSVLDRYVKTVGCQVLDVLKEHGPRRQAIERLFAVSVARLTSETGSYGCLITNIAMERAYCDAQTARRVAAYQQTVEEALAEALQQAQASGELTLRPEADTLSLARFLNGCLQGMRVLARSGPQARARLEAIAQNALLLLT
jgi:TetR/AcrR family transcriptional repressor of nem operon